MPISISPDNWLSSFSLCWESLLHPSHALSHHPACNPRATKNLPHPIMASNEEPSSGIIGRARRASLSIANANPQLGMWQAAGTAIAQAPNLTELRDIDTGADNIAFNSQGHSVRLAAVEEDTGRLALTKTNTTYRSPRTAVASSRKASEPKITPTAEPTVPDASESTSNQEKEGDRHHHHHLHLFHRHHDEPRKKANWGPTILHGLNAFWRFFITPSGFLITVYGLNIVVSIVLHLQRLSVQAERPTLTLGTGMGRK